MSKPIISHENLLSELDQLKKDLDIAKKKNNDCQQLINRHTFTEKKLLKINEKLQEEIEAKVAIEEELRVANEKLEREIKERIRSEKKLEQSENEIRQIFDLINESIHRYKNNLDERGIKYIKIITRGATRMQALIDDLLAISRISTRGSDFLKVKEIIKDVNEVFDLKIYQENVSIVYGKLPTIKAYNRLKNIPIVVLTTSKAEAGIAKS